MIQLHLSSPAPGWAGIPPSIPSTLQTHRHTQAPRKKDTRNPIAIQNVIYSGNLQWESTSMAGCCNLFHKSAFIKFDQKEPKVQREPRWKQTKQSRQTCVTENCRKLSQRRRESKSGKGSISIDQRHVGTCCNGSPNALACWKILEE